MVFHLISKIKLEFQTGFRSLITKWFHNSAYLKDGHVTRNQWLSVE